MNKRLAIHCLGAFSVTLDGAEVTGFESNKARSLLAYLATAAEQPHQRERLAGLLWPDFDDGAARTNLRRVLSNVRRVIGDRTNATPALLVNTQTIQLNVAHVWVDVLAFQEQIASDDLEQWKEAVALYNGRFLDTISLKDSDIFEEWLSLTRRQLQQQMRQTLAKLARAYEKQGNFDKAITLMQRQLTLEPWQETAHQQLMRVLAINGRRAEALRQYESCRSILAQELGVTPEPATIDLYEQIRDGTLHQETAIEPAARQLGNLPTAIRPLIGRQQELAELARLLLDEKRRLLTILGLGGSGKTRLAIALGTAVRHHFPHGVTLVPLAEQGTVEAIIPAIAAALGFTFYEDQPLKQQLCDYLRSKTVLLILDNFEHLLAGSSLVVDLLQAAPHLKIITTSRERLALQGEQLYPLNGLDVKQADGEAVQLFAQRAQLAQANFVVTPTNQTAVHHICRLVEGMPLALLLAASWITLLTPAEIASELEEATKTNTGLDLLQADWRDMPPRQRSLRTVFDYSWQLLSATEQDVCAQLALFQGDFTPQAAQAVTGASLSMLMGLVHRSFLNRSGNGRFTMHELLRQYAAERLARTSPLQSQAATKHAHFYTQFVAQQTGHLQGKEQETALIQLEKDNENIRLAWQWAIQQKAAENLAQLWPGLTLFFLERHRYQEGEAWLAEALSQMQEGEDELVAGLTAAQAHMLARQQHHQTAQTLAQIAAKLSPRNPFTHLQLGHTWLLQGSLAESQHHFEQAQQGYQAMPDSWGEGQAFAGLAETANLQGNYEAAQAQFETSLRLLQTCEDRRGQALVSERLGYVLRDQGQLGLAEQRTMTAVTLYRSIGDQEKIASGSLALSWLLIYMGRIEEAYAAAERGAALLAQAGRPIPLSLLGIINVDRGHYAEAQSLLQRHIALCRQRDDMVELAQGLNVLAAMEIANGRYPTAQTLLEESISLLQQIGMQDRLAHAQAFWGYMARGMGKTEEAWHYFRLALQTAVDIQAIIPLLFSLPGIALLLADKGAIEKAMTIYAPLPAMPIIANSQLRHDLAGAELANIAQQLPSETQKTITQQGEGADIWAIADMLLAETLTPAA